MKLGANIIEGNRTRFLVWAPCCEEVELKILSQPVQHIPMYKVEGGYYEAVVEGVGPGEKYVYILDGKVERSDPASRSQFLNIHEPSEVVDPCEFKWEDADWNNIPLEEYIIYELHIGTYTTEGLFCSLIEKIGYLKELGINAIELMPVAQFSGQHNWGYDGVYFFAPQKSYGGPSALKALINACHKNNIAVILDVVYNHFGAEGNNFEEFGPYYTDKYKTPWGKAVNYDGPGSEEVRRYILDNVLYWITEYHIDALRLDAIHAIFDNSPKHLLEEMSDRVRELGEKRGKKAYLIAESNLNDPKVIKPKQEGGYGLDAQWNDDFHHAVTAYFLNRKEGYFQDFGSFSQIVKAITEGFVCDGGWSIFHGCNYGSSSKGVPASNFVCFLQNHDQIANASQGKRIAASLADNPHKLAALLLFFLPNIPLIFMGQEWASTTPFYYFTNFEDPILQKAVSEGRKMEYASFNIGDDWVDPTTPEAFSSSKIDWRWEREARSVEFFNFYKKLIAMRKSHRCLFNGRSDLMNVQYDLEKKWLSIERRDEKGGAFLMIGNFTAEPQTIPLPEKFAGSHCIFSTGSEEELLLSNGLEELFLPWSSRVYSIGY